MPSPAILKVEELLAPIEGGSPVGPDLRLDYSPTSLFQQIRDARENSRNIERQLEKKEPGYSPDQLEWDKVLKLGVKAIGEQSKDFGIAAWVCEALVRQHGFPGLRDGLRLGRQLAKGFWSGLYPAPEVEEGVEPPSEMEVVMTRVKPFEGLFAGALTGPILAIPVTEDGFTFVDHRQAKELERETDAKAKQARLDGGALSLGEFMASVDGTSEDFYKLLDADLKDCIDELKKFSEVLDAKCGQDEKGFSIAPSTSDTEKVLQQCQELVAELCKVKGLIQETPGGANGDGVAQPAGAGQANLPAVSPGRPAGAGGFTREEAFQQLLLLADFFRRAEPHSPVSHHIEEAVRWGRMGLAELLAELITDEKTRQQVFVRVGIPETVDKKK